MRRRLALALVRVSDAVHAVGVAIYRLAWSIDGDEDDASRMRGDR